MFPGSTPWHHSDARCSFSLPLPMLSAPGRWPWRWAGSTCGPRLQQLPAAAGRGGRGVPAGGLHLSALDHPRLPARVCPPAGPSPELRGVLAGAGRASALPRGPFPPGRQRGRGGGTGAGRRARRLRRTRARTPQQRGHDAHDGHGAQQQPRTPPRAPQAQGPCAGGCWARRVRGPGPSSAGPALHRERIASWGRRGRRARSRSA